MPKRVLRKTAPKTAPKRARQVYTLQVGFDEETRSMMDELAAARGLTANALIRLLIREEHRRKPLEPRL